MIGSVVFLPVEDLERTRRFYTQVLGLELTMVQPAGAEIYDTGYGYWGFCAYGDGRPALSGMPLLKLQRSPGSGRSLAGGVVSRSPTGFPACGT